MRRWFLLHVARLCKQHLFIKAHIIRKGNHELYHRQQENTVDKVQPRPTAVSAVAGSQRATAVHILLIFKVLGLFF